MTGTLVLTAASMGLIGAVHCASMCGLGCAGVARWSGAQPPLARAAWLLGRLLSYALAGAAAASLGQLLRWSADMAAWLRPLWLIMQMAVVALGLFLLIRGHLPAAVMGWAQRLTRADQSDGVQRIRMPGEAKAFSIGLLWAGVPCGLLQAALLLAALASSAAEGAAVMTAFAFASLPGLLLGAALWSRLPALARWRADQGGSMALRVAGAGIAAVTVWPLVHAAWRPVVDALCG